MPKTPRKPRKMEHTHARARTPRQIARQAEVFRLSVIERESVRAIAKALHVTQGTVISDIRHEAQLRANERAAHREADLQIQLAMLDKLYMEAGGRFDAPGTSALPTAAKCLEMRAKLLGLDAPTEVNVGPSRHLTFEVVEATPSASVVESAPTTAALPSTSPDPEPRRLAAPEQRRPLALTGAGQASSPVVRFDDQFEVDIEREFPSLDAAERAGFECADSSHPDFFMVRQLTQSGWVFARARKRWANAI